MSRKKIRARLRRNRRRHASTDTSSHAMSRPLLSPFMAALLHPFLVIASALLVAGATVDYFHDKTVTYSAEATLAVGRIDVPANAVPGYVAANNALASSYSRFVGTDQHIEKVATVAGVTPDEVKSWGRVTATNVPQSPIVRVRAVASNREDALRLADRAAAALVELIGDVNDPTSEGQSLLERHAAAARSMADAQALVDKTQQDLAFYLANNRAQEAADTREAVVRARADFTVQQLLAQTLATLYQESQRYLVDGPIVRPLNSGSFTGSTRSSNMQLGVVAGVVGGVAISVALAWIVTNAKSLLALRRAAVHREVSSVLRNGSSPYPSWPAVEPVNAKDIHSDQSVESLTPTLFRD
jgi:capsular polysaccharide biosynthesis protein